MHYHAADRTTRPAGVSGGRRADRLLPREPVGRSETRDSRRGRHGRAHATRARRAPPAAAAAAAAAADLPSALPTKAGMNRFVWDLRYPGGPAGGGDGEGGGFGGGGGPLVAPGAFKARLTAGGVTKTESFTVKIDPRIAKDGVTVADLAEQTKFSLKVRDALAEARAVQTRVRQAMEAKRGDQAKLQSVWDRLTTKSGPYEDQMFVDQMSNVNREIGRRIRRSASYYERFNQLMKEWTALKAEAEGPCAETADVGRASGPPICPDVSSNGPEVL